MGMTCTEADAIMYAFVDGELSGSDRAAYEAHLLACDACARAARLQARFKAALRGHLPRPEVPEGLRQRIHLAVEAEPPARRQWPWQAYPRVFTAAIAAAAAVVLLVASPRRNPSSPALEQALSTFHHDLPLDVLSQSCAAVTDWFRGKLDFAMPLPAGADMARCQGGRLVNVRDRFGAYVVYQAPAGHRLGLMVVPDSDDLAFGPRRRSLAGREVYVGSSRGVSTAAYHGSDGLTYVFTTDLDEDALAHWVETVYLQRQ
jgi:anti-sigma factor (TIGR02949 family)